MVLRNQISIEIRDKIAKLSGNVMGKKNIASNLLIGNNKITYFFSKEQ